MLKSMATRSSLLAMPLVLAATPALAEVVQSSPAGFEISQTLDVDAPPLQVWTALTNPRRWWDKDHTYSDDSANLSLEPAAGGCFCERLPNGGSVEHARIVTIQPPQLLRMTGALGPLQAEAVTGTLTFTLDRAEPRGTKVTLSYVVGGYVRAGADALAAKVDEVLASEMLNLKAAAEAPAAKSAVPEGR